MDNDLIAEFLRLKDKQEPLGGYDKARYEYLERHYDLYMIRGEIAHDCSPEMLEAYDDAMRALQRAERVFRSFERLRSGPAVSDPRARSAANADQVEFVEAAE